MVQLDSFRFMAVFLVMFGHWIDLPILKEFNWFLASCGVNLFFVLSGFLITGILLKNKGKPNVLRQFYARRFLRIFPLYYLVVFIAGLFGLIWTKSEFLLLVSYTSNIESAFSGSSYGPFSHVWSLAVEEQFYILFPFVVLFTANRRLPFVFLSMTIIAVASRLSGFLFVDHVDWFAYIFTPTCFDCFAIGATLAYLRMYKPNLLQRILQPSELFIFVLSLCITLYIGSYAPGSDWIRIVSTRLLFSIFAFWLIGKASYSQFPKILENRILVYLGRITYGLYVYHYFMPYIFERMFGVKGIALAPVYLLSTIAIASLSWFLFEKPVNSLKRFFDYEKRKTRPVETERETTAQNKESFTYR